jgi:peptide/nickel transport system substrate-binding protein
MTDGREFRYWGGEVYLDEIHFYHYEQDNQTLALASGSIDAVYELTIDQIELAQSIPGAKIASVEAAQTLCCRMQVDAKPFNDVRVRRAIVKSADNAAIRRLVFGAHGANADDFHVAPVHPEYFPLPARGRDVAGAKLLLQQAGFGQGLDISIVVGNNDGPWQQAVCEVLRDQLKDAGINLNVTVVPATKYWEIWNKVPFAATSWAHRPLGTMALAQAYRTGASWNESHYSDPEFDRALADAEATLDVTQRKLKMQKVEQILQDAAVVVQPFWRPVFSLTAGRVHGYLPHPARQMQLNKVWLA